MLTMTGISGIRKQVAAKQEGRINDGQDVVKMTDGSTWEDRVVAECRKAGYLAFRISPARDGGQPCDVAAFGRSQSALIECKVCKNGRFDLSRLEDNQRLTLAQCRRIGATFLLAVLFNDGGTPAARWADGFTVQRWLDEGLKSVKYTDQGFADSFC